MSARQLASRTVVVLDDKELEDDLAWLLLNHSSWRDRSRSSMDTSFIANVAHITHNEFSSRGIMLAERSRRRAPWIGIAMGGNSTRSILSAIQLPTPLLIPSIRSRNSRTTETLPCGFKRR